MGRLQKYAVILTEEEKKILEGFVRRGRHSAREIKRAHILLKADRGADGGMKDHKIAALVDMSKLGVRNVRQRFYCDRLQMLRDKPRSGRPKTIDQSLEEKVVEIASQKPLRGKKRWTGRSIAKHLVEMKYVPRISATTVFNMLKKIAKRRKIHKRADTLEKVAKD